MGVLRGIIGFFTFLVAFAYRGGTDDLDLSGIGTATGSKLHEDLLATDIGADGSSAIALGAVVACSVIGGLIGSIIAPKIRTRISEERMLLGALLMITSIAILGLWAGGISGALVVGLAVGLSVSSGKLAFDSIVQRDAPDANYGRSFARFETRFQLIWVFAALIPVIFTLPARLGFLMLAIAGGTAAITYLLGNNSGTQQTEGILGLLKNLIQKSDVEEQPKSRTTTRTNHGHGEKTRTIQSVSTRPRGRQFQTLLKEFSQEYPNELTTNQEHPLHLE